MLLCCTATMKGHCRQGPFHHSNGNLCLLAATIPLFFTVYILLSLRLDIISSEESSALKDVQSYIKPLVQMQKVISDLEATLTEVQYQRDMLASHLAEKAISSCNDSRCNVEGLQDVISKRTVFSPVTKQLFGCSKYESIQLVGTARQMSAHSLMQYGFYGLDEVVVITPYRHDCRAEGDPATCLREAHSRTVEEMLQFVMLQHPLMLQLLGGCNHGNGQRKMAYVLETYHACNTTSVRKLPWNQRVKTLVLILSFLQYLQDSPLGQLALTNMSFHNFVMDGHGQVRFASPGMLRLGEPPCHDSVDCQHSQLTQDISCTNGRCAGFNYQMMLKQFVMVIMPEFLKSPPVYLQEVVSELQFQSDESVDAGTLLEALSKLHAPGTDDLTQNTRTSSVVNGLHHEDLQQVGGMAVDVSNVVIDQDKFQIREIDNEEVIIWPAGPDEFAFHVVNNMDLPSQSDYACRRSLASWGCQLRVMDLADAVARCAGDPQCRAFSVAPSHTAPGGLTITLKSSQGGLEASKGFTVYLKVLLPNPDEDLDDHQDTMSPDDLETVTMTSCVDSLLSRQADTRLTRQTVLLEALDILEATETMWFQSWRSSPLIVGPQPSRVSHGDVIGGHLTVASGDQKALFVVEQGPTHFHLSHMAFYLMDRLLGLYLTSPSLIHTLSSEELRTSEQNSLPDFTKFDSLMSGEGTLTGVLVHPLTPAVKLVPLTLTAFTNFSTRVNPLNIDQRQQLEYLMLLWLTGTPQNFQHLRQYNGHLVFALVDDAFQQGVDDILPYFYNCQFPKHSIDVLSVLTSTESPCSPASQLLHLLEQEGINRDQMALRSPSLTQFTTLINKAAAKFMTIVDTCVQLFGPDSVLY